MQVCTQMPSSKLECSVYDLGNSELAQNTYKAHD